MQDTPSSNLFMMGRGALLSALVCTVASCGSGSLAAILGSDSGSTTVIDAPFEMSFNSSNPKIYGSIAEADMTPESAGNIPRVRLNFTASLNFSTIQKSDFLIERLKQANEEVAESIEIEDLFFDTDNSVSLFFGESLALNGKYKFSVVGSIYDTQGRPLAGEHFGFTRIADGMFREFPESVAFGQSAVGQISMGPRNRAFASIETILGPGFLPPFLISALTASRDGVWESSEIIYLTEGDRFSISQTGGVTINGTLAVLPIHEGDTSGVHNIPHPDNPIPNPDGKSIITKAFPARVPNEGNIDWGQPTFASRTPGRFRIDRGQPGSPLDGLHLSYGGVYHPIDTAQLQNSSGIVVAAWWALSNEIVLVDNDKEFRDYGVYFNVLDMDPVVPGEEDWEDVGDPITGTDKSVGWPYMTAWDSGRVAILWNDAEDDPNPDNVLGRQRVFESRVPSYGVAIYDHDNGGISSPVEFSDAGADVSRATDFKAFGDSGLLVISRVEGANVDDTAQVGARIFRVGAGNSLTDSPIQMAPGEYNLPISFPLNAVNALPSDPEYAQFRSAREKGPKAVAIDGTRFLVSWTKTIQLTGVQYPVLSIFDTAGNRWANTVLDFQTLFSNLGISGDARIIGVRVDRLGYATLFWSEMDGPSFNFTDFNVQPERFRSLRAKTSLLEVNLDDGSVANIFENATINEIARRRDEAGFTIAPVYPNISNVDRSGQMITFWFEFLILDGIPQERIRLGTSARRFGPN